MNTLKLNRNVVALGVLAAVSFGATPVGSSDFEAALPQVGLSVSIAGWRQTGVFSAEEATQLLEAGDLLAGLAVRDLAAQNAWEAIPALMHFAAGDGTADVMVRIQCVRALADFRGPDVVSFLERIATSAAVEEYREEVVRALGMVGTNQSLQVLDQVPTGPDSHLTVRALERARRALRPRVATAAAAA